MAYVGPTLPPWNEAYLIIVSDLFSSLDSARKYFIEKDCVYIHWGDCSVVWAFCCCFCLLRFGFGFFFCPSFFGLGAASVEGFRSVPFSFVL